MLNKRNDIFHPLLNINNFISSTERCINACISEIYNWLSNTFLLRNTANYLPIFKQPKVSIVNMDVIGWSPNRRWTSAKESREVNGVYGDRIISAHVQTGYLECFLSINKHVHFSIALSCVNTRIMFLQFFFFFNKKINTNLINIVYRVNNLTHIIEERINFIESTSQNVTRSCACDNITVKKLLNAIVLIASSSKAYSFCA